MFAPTVEEIVRDRLTQLSLQYWAGAPDQLPFDPKIVEDIYTEELSAPNPFSRIMLLELAHYLEAYESPLPPIPSYLTLGSICHYFFQNFFRTWSHKPLALT